MPTKVSSKGTLQTETQSADNFRERVEAEIVHNPIPSIAKAFAAGYVIRYLPLRSLVHVLSKLIVPGIFAVGVWKACDAAERACTTRR